ncbi:hypothetical protein ANN_25362 [Periplaneta americana]|uniref:Secreted protein n=1 Tax=Periplaneta americana TaxID=6978 RepID=A0ABQ8S1R7_PERAM|nr:hypothetical protein ANN_25362 [Periplaneta americana]
MLVCFVMSVTCQICYIIQNSAVKQDDDDDGEKWRRENPVRHVAYFCRIAPRELPGLTSPSDEQITINSDICLLFICSGERFGI